LLWTVADLNLAGIDRPLADFARSIPRAIIGNDQPPIAMGLRLQRGQLLRQELSAIIGAEENGDLWFSFGIWWSYFASAGADSTTPLKSHLRRL